MAALLAVGKLGACEQCIPIFLSYENKIDKFVDEFREENPNYDVEWLEGYRIGLKRGIWTCVVISNYYHEGYEFTTEEVERYKNN